MLVVESLLYILIPALLLRFQSQVKIIDWLSPAFWAYALGILLNVLLPLEQHWGEQQMELFVALAIPLLLFSARIKEWLQLAPRTLLAYGLFVLVVLVSVSFSIWYWQDTFADAALRGAMATGVYTGGTANMAAIHVALEGPARLFAEMNFTDLVLSGTLLLCILSFLPPLLGRFLPAFPDSQRQVIETETQTASSHASLSKRVGYIAVSIVGALLVLGMSIGLSVLGLGEQNGTLIVVLLTLIGIGASLIPQVRNWPLSYETGDFLFLCFCIAAGAQIDLYVLWESDWSSAGFLLTTFLCILVLFLSLAKLLGLDRDTALITLTAGFFWTALHWPCISETRQ